VARDAVRLDRRFAQASEFSTFAFYLPVMFANGRRLHDPRQQFGHDGAVWRCGGTGWVDRCWTPKIGHRGSHRRLSIVLVSLLIAAAALYTDQIILPFAAAGMLWGITGMRRTA